jgi:adenylosuccinate synthase
MNPDLTLHAGDMGDRATLRGKLHAMLAHTRQQLGATIELARPDERRVFEDLSWIDAAADVCDAIAAEARIIGGKEAQDLIANGTCPIFEGAQGVLLDQSHGFTPHTTWSDTTFANADTLLDECANSQRLRIGVMRSYLTRHGSGPLVTEDPRLGSLPEAHNRDDGLPGPFRRGILDLMMIRYALKACGGIDALAVGFLDRLRQLPAVVCDAYLIDGQCCEELEPGDDLTARVRRAKARYRRMPTLPDDVLAMLSHEFSVPIACASTGPTRLDKHNRLSALGVPRK